MLKSDLCYIACLVDQQNGMTELTAVDLNTDGKFSKGVAVLLFIQHYSSI